LKVSEGLLVVREVRWLSGNIELTACSFRLSTGPVKRSEAPLALADQKD
jgi:hypothetical protein